MRDKRCIGTEAVRINGVWRTVEVWANALQIACAVGPKAARNKSGRSRLASGAIVVKVVGTGI